MYVVLRDKMPQMCVVGEASITDICGCIDFALLVPSNRGIEWHGVYLVAKIASIIYDRQKFSANDETYVCKKWNDYDLFIKIRNKAGKGQIMTENVK